MATPYLDAIITAGVGGIPTTELWEEIRGIVDALAAESGTDTFGGETGTSVTITDIGSTDYDVAITVVYDAGIDGGSIGEIRVQKVSGTEFVVYNTGSDTTSTFSWRVTQQ